QVTTSHLDLPTLVRFFGVAFFALMTNVFNAVKSDPNFKQGEDDVLKQGEQIAMSTAQKIWQPLTSFIQDEMNRLHIHFDSTATQIAQPVVVGTTPSSVVQTPVVSQAVVQPAMVTSTPVAAYQSLNDRFATSNFAAVPK